MNHESKLGFTGTVGAASLLALLAACGMPETGTESTREATHRPALTTRPAVQTPFLPMNSTATGTGVHVNHGSYGCAVCHLQGGAVQFDPRGAAILPGTLATDSRGNVIVDAKGNATILISSQLPAYDPSTGSCSNIACHYVKPGVYTPPDGAVFGDTYTYAYGSTSATPTPDWYSAPGSAACTACHGYPPSSSDGRLWHSGWHGGASVTGSPTDVMGFNSCSTCHPDVTSTVSGTAGTPTATINTTIKTPAMHGNGVVDVIYNTGDYPCVFCHGG